MPHLGDAACVDVARGIQAPSGPVQLHLQECAPCRARVETFRCFAQFTTSDCVHEPPEYASRVTRAIFALQRPDAVTLARGIVARLRFDSFRDPLPAGVRSGQAMTRHVLYEADDYSLDLRLEHQRGSQSIALTGQVLTRQTPESGPMLVRLLGRTAVVGETRTNAAGEFHIDYPLAERVRICVEHSRNAIVLPEQQLETLEA